MIRLLNLVTDPHTQTGSDSGGKDNVGVLIREAQYKTFRDLQDIGDRGIGFASSFDLRKSWYHPQIRTPAGERAAKWVLVSQYAIMEEHGAEDYWLPPKIESVDSIGGTIRLTMSSEMKTKDDSDGKMLGFAIAGDDRRFYPADVQWYTDGSADNRNQPTYQRSILVLSSAFVPEPVHYRHAWARNPISNIVNRRGVPLATQRSDGWVLEETPGRIAVPDGMPKDAAGRYIANQLRKRLELADLERRVQEAEAALAELTPLLEKARADVQGAN